MSKNPIVKAATSTKNFVSNHRTAITVVAVGTVTTAACVAVVKARGESQMQFIKESGLVDQYTTWLTNLTD